MDLINLFVEEQFWQNFTDMANLYATKVKETAPKNDSVRQYKSDLFVLYAMTNIIIIVKKMLVTMTMKSKL